MVQPNPGTSDLGISSDLTAKRGLRVQITRIPFDEYFTLRYTKDGREVTEELDAEETRAWFKERFKKPASFEQEKMWEEDVGKALDECWNFYETVFTIPPDVYVEPVKRFPQFQPQV